MKASKKKILKSVILVSAVLTSSLGVSLFNPIAAQARMSGRWEPARRGYYPSNAYRDPNLRDTNGEQLYICSIGGALGKLVPTHKKCYIPYGGKERGYSQYNVLVGDSSNYKWLRHTGRIPSSSVAGGSDNGEALYVCTAQLKGGWTPGKFHPSHDTCYIPYGGKEHSRPDFYILAERDVNPDIPNGNNLEIRDGYKVFYNGKLIDHNTETKSVISGSIGVFQIHHDGGIFKWTGRNCSSTKDCPGWVRIDHNPKGNKIAIRGGKLYQTHYDGSTWVWKGEACTPGSCPSWKRV